MTVCKSLSQYVEGSDDSSYTVTCQNIDGQESGKERHSKQLPQDCMLPDLLKS